MKKLISILGILMILLISCETATDIHIEYEHRCLGPISYFQSGKYWWHHEPWRAYNSIDWNDNIEYGVLQEAWYNDTIWHVSTRGYIEADTIHTYTVDVPENTLAHVIPVEIESVMKKLKRSIDNRRYDD